MIILDKTLLKGCISDSIDFLDIKYIDIGHAKDVDGSTYFDITIINKYNHTYCYLIFLNEYKTISINTTYAFVHYVDFNKMDNVLNQYHNLLKQSSELAFYAKNADDDTGEIF